MNHLDRMAPLVVSLLVVGVVVAGLLFAAAELSARLNGLAL